jgi:hypothetical protein
MSKPHTGSTSSQALPKGPAENPSKSLTARFLKDPLIHFIVLGGLLFVGASLWGGGTKPQDEIIITKAAQQHLADLFEITWQRKPNAEELKNLTQEHIKEEIYYREALALGLDENDTIVRRRLRQKLEFMQEDLSSLTPPSETDLRAFFENHKDDYKTDHILSFQQIVVSSKRLNPDNPQIIQALEKLKSGAIPHTLSKSSLLPVAMKLENEKSIANTFGESFVKEISTLPIGEWQGPITSGFGTHLVNINLNQNSKPLAFEQARNKVAVDYTQFQREAAATNYYDNLRNQYRISIEDMP